MSDTLLLMALLLRIHYNAVTTPKIARAFADAMTWNAHDDKSVWLALCGLAEKEPNR